MMQRVIEVHPSHLHVVAATLLLPEPAPTFIDHQLWRYKSQDELAEEYARAFAVVRPEEDAETIVGLASHASRAVDWSWFQISEQAVTAAIERARAEKPPCVPVPKPRGLLVTVRELLVTVRGLLRCPWPSPARTCARQSTWLLPLELRDVWPRIFEELVASTAFARQWRANKDSKLRAARLKGVVDAMRDGEDTCACCLAYVLRDQEDLRQLRMLIETPRHLWQAVSRLQAISP